MGYSPDPRNCPPGPTIPPLSLLANSVLRKMDAYLRSEYDLGVYNIYESYVYWTKRWIALSWNKPTWIRRRARRSWKRELRESGEACVTYGQLLAEANSSAWRVDRLEGNRVAET